VKITVIRNIYIQKLNNQTAAHEIMANFVSRFTYFNVIPYPVTRNIKHYDLGAVKTTENEKKSKEDKVFIHVFKRLLLFFNKKTRL